MKERFHSILFFILLFFAGLSAVSSCNNNGGPDDDDPTDTTDHHTKDSTDVVVWLTTTDKTWMLEKSSDPLLFNTKPNQYPTIEVDTALTYQTMDGFGFAMTGGSAWLINKLPATDRTALIKELFSPEGKGIGISYLRISIGASDLDASAFSYDDMPAGQTDVDLGRFTLAKDKTDLIPVLKQVLLVNPDIKIMGSPWSAPAWMKTNNNTVGGRLRQEYYDAYARYFVKYIQGMLAEGIRLDAITVQNEPLNPYNNPSMEMSSAEQAAFIKNNLGPAFRTAGLTTKIIVYDHNCDHPEYPLSILNDADARPYVDGSAFHLYAGDISVLSQVHETWPEKNVYFTEQWVGGPSNWGPDLKWHVRNLIIGATRNWSRVVLEWNLASDPSYQPHTPGGCTSCEGALTLTSSTVTRNVSYYIIGQASKFVPSGSERIASTIVSKLQNVAFKTPAGKKVIIVYNESDTEQYFNLSFNGKKITTSLLIGSVATYIW